jgi:hypothetical protein
MMGGESSLIITVNYFPGIFLLPASHFWMKTFRRLALFPSSSNKEKVNVQGNYLKECSDMTQSVPHVCFDINSIEESLTVF